MTSCSDLLAHSHIQVSPQYNARLAQLDALMSHQENYKVYRVKLRQSLQSSAPVLPYLGLVLQDLTFLDEGNSDKTPAGLLNVFKMYKIRQILDPVLQMQKQLSSYLSFESKPDLLAYCRNLPTVSVEEAYRLSLRVEPRNTQEAVETLLMEEAELRRQVKELQLRNAELEQLNAELQSRLQSQPAADEAFSQARKQTAERLNRASKNHSEIKESLDW